MTYKTHLKYLYLTILIVLTTQISSAQNVKVSSYELGLGFYVGSPIIWGDYNAGLLGTGYTYQGGDVTPNFIVGSDNNYGVSLWFPLFNKFTARLGYESGTLSYQIPNIIPNTNYNQFTPYSVLSFNLQYDFSKEAFLNPYLSVGFESFSYKTPLQNDFLPDMNIYSTLDPYQDAQTTSIPITLGFNVPLGDISTFFAEANFRMTNSDVLDNFTPDDSPSSFGNDVVFSYQAGIRVQVISFVRLFFNTKKPAKVKPFSTSRPSYLAKIPSPKLIDFPKIDTLETPDYVTDVIEDSSSTVELDVSVPSPTPAPIPIVNLEEREFDPQEELKKVEEIRKQAESEPEPIKNENSNLDWDPRIPVIQTKSSLIPDEILDNGFAIANPPEGYYVQVFATVGPKTATRARQMTIDALMRTSLLQDPEQQVIVTKRKQFYEVRIGVFDKYDQTLRVLEYMQGIFFDSYTLIYLPDDQ